MLQPSVMEETEAGVGQDDVVVVAGGDNGRVVGGPGRGGDKLHAALHNLLIVFIY